MGAGSGVRVNVIDACLTYCKTEVSYASFTQRTVFSHTHNCSPPPRTIFW